MKTDLTLSALAKKVDNLAKLKKDFLVNTNELSIISNHHSTYLDVQGTPYLLQSHAASQLASIAGIPYSYYERLSAYPELRDTNLNTLLADIDKKRMVRTLGRNARSILSDRYRLIDNDTVLSTLMPILDEVKGLQVVSASITDERMYVKVISRQSKRDVVPGDTVAFGACLVNSEIGVSSISITGFQLRMVCSNGLCLPFYDTTSPRRIHKGKQITCMDDYDQLYAEDDNSLYERLKDQLAAALNPEYHMKVIDKMREALKINIPNPMETCERIAKLYSLDPSEKAQILMHFLTGKRYTLYDMVQAVTRTATDARTYQRASELEKLGSQLLYDGLAAVAINANSNNLLLAS